MPRYYFDICDSRGQVQDEEGTECADLVKQYVDSNRPITSCHIAIRD